MRHGHETVKIGEGKPAGRHRRGRPQRARRSSRAPRTRIAALLLACVTTAAVAAALFTSLTVSSRPTTAAATPATAADLDRSARAEEASRKMRRSAPASQSPSASPTPSPTRPAHPRPVAGLTQAQMDNANIIVSVGIDMKLPDRAYLVAVATAMQESTLYNLASSAVPESLKYPHQGVAVDHDSVGLFQQRTSMGWGTVAQIMDPEYASRRFYGKLVQISGWEKMSVADAAQAVQRSAYPYAYAKHEARARTIVDALT